MKYIKKEKFTKPYTPADVLKLALEKEKASYKFYNQLILSEVRDRSLVPVLERLRASEEKHIKIIQGMLDK